MNNTEVLSGAIGWVVSNCRVDTMIACTDDPVIITSTQCCHNSGFDIFHRFSGGRCGQLRKQMTKEFF